MNAIALHSSGHKREIARRRESERGIERKGAGAGEAAVALEATLNI